MRQLDEAENVADGCYLPISMILNNVEDRQTIKIVDQYFFPQHLFIAETLHRKNKTRQMPTKDFKTSCSSDFDFLTEYLS